MADGTDKRLDLLIVGAGPVGLALAVELARRGVDFRIVEKNPAPTVHTRAAGVQARTLELLEKAGVAEEMVALGRKVTRITGYSGGRTLFRMELEGLDSPYPFLLVLPQSQTERILERRLEELGGQVERRSELLSFRHDAGGVVAVIRREDGSEEEVAARFLAGCDGAHSTVRHLLGLSFEGKTYREHFALADVALDWDRTPGEAHFFLSPEGVLGAIPLPQEGRWRLIAQVSPEVADIFTDGLPLSLFATLLKRRAGSGEVHDPEWLSGFTLHRRMVRAFNWGPVFLCGDAAHIHSPVGGQGMNIGIHDAFNLAWKLGLVSSGASSAHILTSYDAERRPVAKRVLTGTDLATRAITLRGDLPRGMRDGLLSFLGGFRPLRGRMARGVAELNHSYSDGLIREKVHLLKSGPFDMGRPRAGERAPDATFGVPPQRLYPLLHGTGHTLLVFSGEQGGERELRLPAETAARLVSRYAGLLEALLVTAAPAAAAFAGLPLVADPDFTLHRRYGARDTSFCLIRPDGYLGYRAMPADPIDLECYLGGLFDGPRFAPST